MTDVKRRLGKYLWLVIAVLVLILSVNVAISITPFVNTSLTEITPIKFEGTFQAKPNTQPIPITDSDMVSTYWHKSITLKGNFDRNIKEGEQLFFLIKYLEVHIYLNGTELYSFGTKESRPSFMRSSGMTWSHCIMPYDITPNDEIIIILKDNYKNNYYSAYDDFIDNLQTGDSGALARKVFAENWYYVLGSVVFFFLSLLLLLFSAVLSVRKITVHKSVYLFTGFGMTVSFWIFLDPTYSSLLVGNSVLIMQLETLTMILSSVLTIAYLSSLMRTKSTRHTCQMILCTFLLVCVILMLLQLYGLTDPYAMRTTLVIVMGVLALVSVWTVFGEIKRDKDNALHFLLAPGGVFILFAVLEMCNYGLEWYPTGKALFLGFFIWLTAQFILAVRFLCSAIQMSQQAEKLENELVQSRISIMLSQIQPHFLYNSLTAIKTLCIQDPTKASEAVTHFTKYLRGNIESLSTDKLIPFEMELEHIKQYLALEQMRFGEWLKISWQIEVKDFHIPPLTIQPIVENAVRYGATKIEGVGTVSISTSETENTYLIIVTDNGVGFESFKSTDGSRSHIGLENVKSRLDLQCEGTIHIDSTINAGTTVTITIPKGEIK